MASIFFLQYLQQKPSSFLWIITQTILSTTIIGLFGLLLWVFRDLNVFVGYNRFTAIRFFLITFSFIIYFTIVSRGFSFFFNGLLNPNVLSLTPEFERVVIPALSGVAIVAYRLTRIFRSKALDVFREISRDIIMFSLLMFWLASNVSLVGLNLATDIPFQSVEDANLLGFVVAIFYLGFEGFLLWVKKDLQQTGRSANLNSLF
jgi:hypothetical protein